MRYPLKLVFVKLDPLIMRISSLTSISQVYSCIKSISILVSLLIVFSTFTSKLLSQSCDFGPCVNYTSYIDIDAEPDCNSTGNNHKEDLDDLSDCNDPNGPVSNCFTWVIYKSPTSEIIGIYGTVGQGAGCTGEIDNVYVSIGGSCVDYGSTGSQNTYVILFGSSDEIAITICDGSSGIVSICELCAVTPALPVEISFFNLERKENKIELIWETLSEVNNDGFFIQRSKDGVLWEDIGFEKGIGTSNEVNRYNFNDEDITIARVYYRLKQVDFDGAYSYSDVREHITEHDSSLREAMELGTFFNLQGQRVYEKKGLLLVSYKRKTYKVFFPF